MRTTIRLFLLATLVTGAACTVKDTTAPPLSGPSELALRLALQITPDSIMQDGASQAVLTIDASTPDGRAARGLAMRVEVLVDGIIQDYGTLSAKSVVTGEDGRARVSYTAPPRPASQVDAVNVIQLRVTPIGSDYGGEVGRFVSLRLMTPGVILPPNESPGAAFTFSPEAPAVLQDVVFDAASSVDGPVLDDSGSRARCGASCQYQWDFGDGSTGTGVFVSHRFQRTGVYLVKLTVTDGGGASATITQAVTVAQGQAPSASFTFSPTAPVTSQDIFFNASASTAVSGRRIVAYEWDFGSGRTGTGMTIAKRYDTAGTYVVTLTVTDDSGSRGTTQQSVTVVPASGPVPGAAPTSIFTFSPTAPSVNQTVFFNGSGSTAPVGTTITSYAWDFGDGTSGSGATSSHAYSAIGTYVVRLTVTNSAGQSGTSTQTVAVTAATSGLTARLTVGPNPGNTGTNFLFDASTSTPASSSTPIVEYTFRFGDGQQTVTTSPSVNHRYAANGTYQATVTIRDSAGNTVTSTAVTVTVSIALQARITATPTTGTTATNFFFDARGSTPATGTFITNYRFVFGDGTPDQVSTTPTATHSYATTGTYTVTVTITDNLGDSSTAVVTITVTP